MNKIKDKKKKYRLIPLSEALSIIYKDDPEAEARINAKVESLRLTMRLREIRRNANISQLELAEKSGVGQDKISKIERGSHNFTIQTLQKIAAAMGKEVKIELV